MFESINDTATDSLTILDSDQADSLCPKEFNYFSVPSVGLALWLPVTAGIPRLHYYLKGVLVGSSGSATIYNFSLEFARFLLHPVLSFVEGLLFHATLGIRLWGNRQLTRLSVTELIEVVTELVEVSRHSSVGVARTLHIADRVQGFPARS